MHTSNTQHAHELRKIRHLLILQNLPDLPPPLVSRKRISPAKWLRMVSALFVLVSLVLGTRSAWLSLIGLASAPAGQHREGQSVTRSHSSDAG